MTVSNLHARVCSLDNSKFLFDVNGLLEFLFDVNGLLAKCAYLSALISRHCIVLYHSII
jgi:hypothetical protein